MTSIISLEQKRLEEILREMHHAQKCSFFLEDVMGKVIDKLELSEEEAIEIARFLINNQFISTGSFLPATFLRPGHIRMFPIVLTSKALLWLTTGNKKR